MPCELCTTYNGNHGVNKLESAIGKWPRLANFVTGIDMALEWVTERLDREFVTAMERCMNEDPDKKREMKLLKRTVLVLICVGLGISVVCIKLSMEAQMAYAMLG